MISDESDRFNPREPRPADAGKPSKSEKRRAARQLATQALYQRHMASTSLNEIKAQFRVDNDFTFADASYFHDILHGVPASLTEIDAALAPCLDLTIEELDPVELCVLRLSAWVLSVQRSVTAPQILSFTGPAFAGPFHAGRPLRLRIRDAARTASSRELTSSLRYRFFRCERTVSDESTRFFAIWSVVAPVASRSSTSHSRSVSCERTGRRPAPPLGAAR